MFQIGPTNHQDSFLAVEIAADGKKGNIFQNSKGVSQVDKSS